MNTILVGGLFSESGGKTSGIIRKLGQTIECTSIINGGTLGDLDAVTKMVPGHNLVLWFPNISNEIDKNYPRKDRGAILICSKVMREGYNRYDSCSRIFQLHGNAVIEIYKEETGFRFILVDALANEWANTMDLKVLSKAITEFCEWTRSSIRSRSSNFNKSRLETLSELTRTVADKVEANKGKRYFGNVSTRCESMFPTTRINSGIYVSKRNIDKNRIGPDDFVLVSGWDRISCMLSYEGDNKPSVDTPIQMELYSKLSGLGCMIHGHAYIAGAPETDNYYPCGDVREATDILQKIDTSKDAQAINLRYHGFLLLANCLPNMEKLIGEIEFYDIIRAEKGGFNSAVELRQEVKDELDNLTPEQKEMVLKGLDGKLGFYERTRELSYKYNVCPICIDVGSTEEDPKCNKCYLKIGCKEPFTQGFRYNPIKGHQYFTAMRDYLETK